MMARENDKANYELCGVAVAITVQHAEKFAPRADGFAVLARHDARDLMQMGEIMYCPRSKQLRERNGAESGMTAGMLQLVGLQVQGAQGCEVFRTKMGEFRQQCIERFVFALVFACLAVKRWKRARIAELKNVAGTRHPVHVVCVKKMRDHGKDSPGSAALVAMNPKVRQVAQQSVERGGSMSEEC
jgi:hypothetical protein